MIVAVDTGGTKTLIELFDTAGKKQFVDKFPTPRDTHEYIQKVSQVISHHTKPGDVDIIVVALPGPIRDNVLLRSKNLGWERFDVLGALKVRFPSTRVCIGNDADLAGLAETRALEKTIHPEVSLYLTLSTGIGGGLCFRGRLFPGLARFEAGWMYYEYDGKLQKWENFASGRNFYERYNKFGHEVDDEDKWRDYAERVSVGLLGLLPLLEPDTLIIGGSMGTHYRKYGKFLDEILQKKIAKHMKNVKISQAKHPEEAVIYGCYYHALDELGR